MNLGSPLDTIAEALLKREKVVFLFGAGASIPSGIDGAEILKSHLWREKLAVRDPKVVLDSVRKLEISTSDWAGVNSSALVNSLTFEQLITVACDLEGGADQIEKEAGIASWLEGKIRDVYTSPPRYFPSYSYEFVCHLLSNGLLSYIISMNYDELLDKAIDGELGKGPCFRVVTLEDFERLNSMSQSQWTSIADCFLVKPHGTRSMRRSCRYRVQDVRQFERDKREVLEKILSGATLVLIGFAASDADFRNLLGDLGLDKIRQIIAVKRSPASVIDNLGGKSDRICAYSGDERSFALALGDALYGNGSPRRDEYNRFYTRATRHFIRALVYSHINPTSADKRSRHETIAQHDPCFFERLDLLLEIIIYCFKVRGLFTNGALSTCPRIVSALNAYLDTAHSQENPIEQLLRQLERERVLVRENFDALDRWYYLPWDGRSTGPETFHRAAQQVSRFVAEHLEPFLSEQDKRQLVEDMVPLLTKLPQDFDYDLSKSTSLYFLPLKNIERITRREQLRDRTEHVLRGGEEGGIVYIMSPSAGEWLWTWGEALTKRWRNFKVIVNKDVLEKADSLHFAHISKGLGNLSRILQPGNIRAVKGVEYGLTLVFNEANGRVHSGRAILFRRYGKASTFSAVFVEENEHCDDAGQSDIQRLKQFFEAVFETGESLSLSALERARHHSMV